MRKQQAPDGDDLDEALLFAAVSAAVSAAVAAVQHRHVLSRQRFELCREVRLVALDRDQVVGVTLLDQGACGLALGVQGIPRCLERVNPSSSGKVGVSGQSMIPVIADG